MKFIKLNKLNNKLINPITNNNHKEYFNIKTIKMILKDKYNKYLSKLIRNKNK